MKIKYFTLLCMVVTYLSCAVDSSVIEPTTHFSMNFCNFPQAWTVSKGEGVQVGIVFHSNENSFEWRKLVQRLAPEASVRLFSKAAFLEAEAEILNNHILFLAEDFSDQEVTLFEKALEKCSRERIIVILPAYFGPMEKTRDYESWRSFVNKAASMDVVIVGVHGRAFQLGHTEFWKNVPIDTFALSRRVDGDSFFGTRSYIDSSSLEESSYLVVGAAALLKSMQPDLTPSEVKKIFQTRGRKMLWMISDIRWNDGENWQRAWPLINLEELERRETALKKGGYKILDVIEGHCFDAALILGLEPMRNGEWSFEALRVAEAHQLATGRGVVVAILDHMFDAKDPSLKGRTFNPGSVLEGAPVFDPETSFGHGTWMARDLVRVAPDVKIIPVRFCGRGRYGDPDLYIKGIEYAVKNGADIISISHQPIPEDRQTDFDRAVENAVKRGVTVVYIHYKGSRSDVVIPTPIEFALFYKGEDHVYVIGTNFIDESSFPYTWGFSQTAPIVSGVIALMKEINPKLKPSEIRQILLDSGRSISADFQILDAYEALKNSKFYPPLGELYSKDMGNLSNTGILKDHTITVSDGGDIAPTAQVLGSLAAIDTEKLEDIILYIES